MLNNWTFFSFSNTYAYENVLYNLLKLSFLCGMPHQTSDKTFPYFHKLVIMIVTLLYITSLIVLHGIPSCMFVYRIHVHYSTRSWTCHVVLCSSDRVGTLPFQMQLTSTRSLYRERPLTQVTLALTRHVNHIVRRQSKPPSCGDT